MTESTERSGSTHSGTSLGHIPRFSPTQQRELLALATGAIEHTLHTGRRVAPVDADLEPWLRKPAASFVTLRRGHRLLGCMGTLEPYQGLAADVVEHALNAAFDDPRMPPVDAEDFERMTVEISVLGPLNPLHVSGRAELVAVLRPHVDGLLVRADSHRATFLPAVWDSVESASDFVALLWRKAGLAPDRWPSSTQLWTYGVCSFEAHARREGAAQGTSVTA